MHANIGNKSNLHINNNNNLNSSHFYPIETSPPKNNPCAVNTATSELANSTSNVLATNNLSDNNNYLDCQIKVVPSSHQQ
mgnify:CR=1 FL=1